MKEVEKALLVLMQSLLTRMRIDLTSNAAWARLDSASTHEVIDGGQWVARPQTLRLTTRPRPPLEHDGSRPRFSSRISKSCDMPSIAFSSLDSIEGIAEKIVHDKLVPLFHKLHPETSDWDLSLINVCAANMLQLASDDHDGAGRDISHMFRKQTAVLKEWNVENDGIPHNPRFQRSDDRDPDSTCPTTGTETLVEASNNKWKDNQTLIQDNHVDENASNGKEELARVGQVCKICGAYMPIFAISAHERFHSMPD